MPRCQALVPCQPVRCEGVTGSAISVIDVHGAHHHCDGSASAEDSRWLARPGPRNLPSPEAAAADSDGWGGTSPAVNAGKSLVGAFLRV